MRFGNWRGVAIACALTATFSCGMIGRQARADLFHHTIPREVEAIDVHTGGPYMAPPVPYGHYAKGGVGGHFGMICGLVRGGLCGLGCKGAGCGLCGGKGCGGDGCGDDPCGGGHCGGGHCGLLGGGLFHKNGCGDPCGDPCGGGGGHCGLGGGLFHKKGCGGDPCGGDPCGACGGSGCGFCHGMGLLKKGCGTGLGGCFGKAPGGCSMVQASAQAPIVSPQCITGSPQCGDPGCRLLTRHWHRRGRGCTQCNGMGCGICQSPGMLSGSLCDSCHGSGCGICGGRGLFGGGDPGRACGGCGGRGCGLCGGRGLLGCGDPGKGCGACGGRGCGLCGGGLMKASHILGLPHALVAKAFHVGEIKYFVGPGGPVPLTPGYVPYVVTTRSPRDFFAFPPFVDTQP